MDESNTMAQDIKLEQENNTTFESSMVSNNEKNVIIADDEIAHENEHIFENKLKDVSYRKASIHEIGSIFALVLFYGFVVFSHFLKEHFVHDTYLITQFGYKIMPKQLLAQGRPISSFFYYILMKFNPPYRLTMFLSVSLSILFLTVATIVLYLLLQKINKSNSIEHKLFSVVACTSMFFTLYITDLLLFFENCVLSFGILCSVVALYFLIRNKKFDIVWCCLCLVTSVFCYQAAIAYFLPLAILLIGKKYEENIKKIILTTIYGGLLYIIALISNYMFLKLFNNNEHRFNGEIVFSENMRFCLRAIQDFLRNNLDFMHNYVFTLFLLMFVAIFVIKLIQEKKVIKGIVLIISLVCMVFTAILPHLAMATKSWYIMPRSAVALTSIVGLSMFGIGLNFKSIKKPLIIISMLFVFIISFKLIDIGENNYANNKLDKQEISYIAEVIKDYEKKHNIIISEIYLGYDSDPLYFRKDIRNYRDLTIRILSVSWMPNPLINAELGRQYPEIFMNEVDKKKYFEDKNWDQMSGEQFAFEGDKLYLCLY